MDSSARLKEFVAMAYSAKGEALIPITLQALECPGLFTFAELLEVNNILELEFTPHRPHLQLLQIFSYGTFDDYKALAGALPELSIFQVTKLKQLTLVTLAERQKRIPYVDLLQKLSIPNVRALEDLIIDAIYTGVIKGKLDQKTNAQVEDALGRDLRPGELTQIIGVLEHWATRTDHLLTEIDENIERVASVAAKIEKENDAFEAELERNKARISKRPDTTDDRRIGPGLGDFNSQEYFDEDNRRTNPKSRSSKLKSTASSSASSTSGPRRGPQRT